jgi:hypothetical protein
VIWKHWKHGRKRFAALHQRGIGRDLAAKTAGSPHGPWRIANSPALAMALPKAYFDSLGIPGWQNCASSTRRTAVYGPVRTVVSQGQRATAYLCKLAVARITLEVPLERELKNSRAV